MKRNWDTVRRILLAIENEAHHVRHGDFLRTLGGDREVRRHFDLLMQAGFISSFSEIDMGLIISGLTMSGHDLLDQIRDKNP